MILMINKLKKYLKYLDKHVNLFKMVYLYC